MILFENLFKPGQLHLAVDMLLTSSVLSATSKQCFEQPETSFLIDALIFIAYNQKEKFSPEKHIE
ncbi:S1 RNA-binding domain-containing protein [Streptococcus pneumoniae]|nr:S1 RNA-binding domain-containing protein [Streptococcus pneumoniae]